MAPVHEVATLLDVQLEEAADPGQVERTRGAGQRVLDRHAFPVLQPERVL